MNSGFGDRLFGQTIELKGMAPLSAMRRVLLQLSTCFVINKEQECAENLAGYFPMLSANASLV